MAERVTSHINHVPAVNIHHATRFAQRSGLPLNTLVTINFTELDVAASASRIFRKFLAQRFAPWLRRSAPSTAKPTYVWAIENTAKTVAAHWMVHIPKRTRRAFVSKLVGWLEGLS